MEICQWRLTKHITFHASSNIPYHRCIMCFTFCGHPAGSSSVCFHPPAYHPYRVPSPGFTWDPRGQSRYREPPSLLRGSSMPGKTSSQNERWGKLGHEFRSFHPKLFTLTDMSAHRVGWGGRGASAFCQKIWDLLWPAFYYAFDDILISVHCCADCPEVLLSISFWSRLNIRRAEKPGVLVKGELANVNLLQTNPVWGKEGG